MSGGILSRYDRRPEKEPDKQDPMKDDTGHCGYVSGREIRWNVPKDPETQEN